MNRKKIMALVMAMAMVGMAAAPSITSEAAGLTQATDPSQVVYGTVSEEDIELLRSLFDAEWYLKENPELADFFGNDTEALFKHFYKCGLFEGRTCSSLFDPAAYASAYGDLEAMYGNNILKYYEHYIKSTPEEKELRPLTTVAACAQAGVTVHSMVSSDVQITPIAYMIAERLGTNDYGAVQSAVNSAVAAAKSSGGSGTTASSAESSEAGETIVVTPADSESALLAQAKGLELVGTLTIDTTYGTGTCEILIYKGSIGYAAYKGSDTYGVNPQAKASTAGYIADLDSENMLKPENQIAYFDLSVATAEAMSSWGVSSDVPDSGNCIGNVDSQDYSTVVSEETTGTVFSYHDDFMGDVFEAVDPEGTASTEYTATVSLDNPTDSGVDVSIGVYNEDDGFAFVGEYSIDLEQQ